MRLSEKNIKLANYMANKYQNNGIEFEELLSAAYIGLVKAEKNFNDELGYKFSTFACDCISMEMKKIFSKRKKKTNGVTIISLEEPIYGEDGEKTVADSICSENDFENYFSDREDLRKAYNKLNEREKKVIKCRYYEKKSQLKTSKELKMSPLTVKQVEEMALFKLRRAMMY